VEHYAGHNLFGIRQKYDRMNISGCQTNSQKKLHEPSQIIEV